MEIDIVKVKVLTNLNDRDVVIVQFGPTVGASFPTAGLDPVAQIFAEKGFGITWVQNNFHREPDEVVDCGGVIM